MTDSKPRCTAMILTDGWHSSRCSRAATVRQGEHGPFLWCAQHSPAKVAARRKASAARYSATLARLRYEDALGKWRNACVAAIEGAYNDREGLPAFKIAALIATKPLPPSEGGE